MSESNLERAERDDLLLMRYIDGRLSGADAAALKARLAAESVLREKLAALELENDLIAGAVSVPDDVELPEPVMAAIIDQALKDPKRQPAERRWWKPVTLSLGAAAAVVLAVLSIYMAGNEQPDALYAERIAPEKNSVVLETGTGDSRTTTLLAQDAQIVSQAQISTAGGAASVTLREGITLHLDHNTRLKLLEVRPGHPVIFELLTGALIAEYAPPSPATGAAAEDAARSVIVRTADGSLEATLTSGRILIQPLGSALSSGLKPEYLVYMPNGVGAVAAPRAAGAAKPVVHNLTSGTQLRWPLAVPFNRTVHSDSLVCDLLLGWQAERAHAAGRWWLSSNLTYQGLDQAWPVEWAGDVAESIHAPSFLQQARALSETITPEGNLVEAAPAQDAPAFSADVLQRWLDMARTFDDKALYDQLTPARRFTWDLLSIKANLMAYRAARKAQNQAAVELPLQRLAGALRQLEEQAAKQPDDQQLKIAAVWLRMESDLLDERNSRNLEARYQAFVGKFPVAVESMSLQCQIALLAPVGDARLQQLNLAWQHCHAFQVHLETALREYPAARIRLTEIQTAILGAIADELYAQGQAHQADELIRTFDYLGLALPDRSGHGATVINLWDKLVAQAVSRAEVELQAGRYDRVAPILTTHMPNALAQALLREPDPANPACLSTPATAERWARCYAAWLIASNQPEALQKFRQQAHAFLPVEPTPPPAPIPAP